MLRAQRECNVPECQAASILNRQIPIESDGSVLNDLLPRDDPVPLGRLGSGNAQERGRAQEEQGEDGRKRGTESQLQDMSNVSV